MFSHSSTFSPGHNLKVCGRKLAVVDVLHAHGLRCGSRADPSAIDVETFDVKQLAVA